MSEVSGMSAQSLRGNTIESPILSSEETRRLLLKAQNGSERAREVLVNSNLRLVWNMVQRFAQSGYDLEDLFQIGCIGLLKAIDKFNLAYDVAFSTYAVPLIIGEIKQFLRDDHPVKISRNTKELALKIQRTKEELTKQLHREPTINEIAHELGVGKEEIVAALEAMQPVTSYQELVYQNDGGEPIFVIDQIKSDKDNLLAHLENLDLQRGLAMLDERERKVILLRFFKEKTQAEVAKILGVSQVQVSRIEHRALETMKKFLK